jgi:hypothetical protein
MKGSALLTNEASLLPRHHHQSRRAWQSRRA